MDAAHGHAPEVVGEQLGPVVIAVHVRIPDDGGQIVVNKIPENRIRKNANGNEGW